MLDRSFNLPDVGKDDTFDVETMAVADLDAFTLAFLVSVSASFHSSLVLTTSDLVDPSFATVSLIESLAYARRLIRALGLGF